LARARANGSWMFLGTQLFVFEWAGMYATQPSGFNGKTGRGAATDFITSISDDMDAAMRNK